jgi:dienelactone hydrolase
MHSEYIDYSDGNVVCEGYAAHDDTNDSLRGGVLVSHAWGGQSDLERKKADELAALGYVGFAVDLYGKGNRGSNPDENAALMQPFLDDRAMLLRRLAAGFSALKTHPCVDTSRIAAIGYCFGGLCVLDLARGVPADLLGVISVHGLFHPPNLGRQQPITAKILMLHGYDDPLAPPDQMLAVAAELTEAQADWQLHAYGNTSHAFTNPNANDPEHGLMYNAVADRRANASIEAFLREVLI